METNTKPINTSAITRALRKSDLTEYKVLERTPQKKIIKEQNGWIIDKHEGYATVRQFSFPTLWGEQWTHPEYTTKHYAELMQWVDSVVAVLTNAGLSVEVVKDTRRAGHLNKWVVEVIKEIRVFVGDK
jgi:hypothetical protein